MTNNTAAATQRNAAFEMLEEMRSATLSNAAPLPLKENVHPQWQGLGFQLGGLRVASAMGEISEILKLPKLAALPGVKSWVLGIANVRGRLIPIIALHEYLGLTPTLPLSQWRVVVIEDEDLAAGLLVEQSLGIQHFLEESFEEVATDDLEALGPYVAGAFRHSGRLFYQIHLRAILRNNRSLTWRQPQLKTN